MSRKSGIPSILKNPENPVDSFTRLSLSGPILLSPPDRNVRKRQQAAKGRPT